MSQPLTPALIAEQLAICDAATREKWQEGVAGNCNLVSYDGDDIVGVGVIPAEQNMRFIISARTYYRAALEMAEVVPHVNQLLNDLESENAKLSEALRFYEDFWNYASKFDGKSVIQHDKGKTARKALGESTKKLDDEPHK